MSEKDNESAKNTNEDPAKEAATAEGGVEEVEGNGNKTAPEESKEKEQESAKNTNEDPAKETTTPEGGVEEVEGNGNKTAPEESKEKEQESAKAVDEEPGKEARGSEGGKEGATQKNEKESEQKDEGANAKGKEKAKGVKKPKMDKGFLSFPFDLPRHSAREEVRKRQSRLLFPNEADGLLIRRPHIPWPDMILVSQLQAVHELSPECPVITTVVGGGEYYRAEPSQVETFLSEVSLTTGNEIVEKLKRINMAKEHTLSAELEMVELLKKRKKRKPRGWLLVPMPLYACDLHGGAPVGDIFQMKPPYPI